MQRLQKERDGFQEEIQKLHERIDIQQNQAAKLQRDKENLLSELELVKERWEKVHNSHQKVTVSISIHSVGLVCRSLSYSISLFRTARTRRCRDWDRDIEGETGESTERDEQGTRGPRKREQGIREDAREVWQVNDHDSSTFFYFLLFQSTIFKVINLACSYYF